MRTPGNDGRIYSGVGDTELWRRIREEEGGERRREEGGGRGGRRKEGGGRRCITALYILQTMLR